MQTSVAIADSFHDVGTFPTLHIQVCTCGTSDAIKQHLYMPYLITPWTQSGAWLSMLPYTTRAAHTRCWLGDHIANCLDERLSQDPYSLHSLWGASAFAEELPLCAHVGEELVCRKLIITLSIVTKATEKTRPH